MKKKSENIDKTNKHLFKKKGFVRFIYFLFLFVFFIFFSSFKNNNFNKIPDVKDTIYIYDTVVYYDTTVVYDTVYLPSETLDDKLFDSILNTSKKTYLGNSVSLNPKYFLIKKTLLQKKKKLNLMSIDFLVSPFFNSQQFKSDYLYQKNSDANNLASNPFIGLTYSFYSDFYRHNTVFTSGIQYTDFKINFSAISAEYNIDTVPKIHFEARTEISIDSVALINIDTLIATGDTVYYYFKDTTYYTTVDTVYRPEPDTSINYFTQKNINSLKYIEIPLFFGKTFYTPSLNFTPQAGIITSFFVNSKGKIVSLTDLYKTDNISDKIKFANINLSLFLGMSLSYYISKRFDLVSSMYFRRNIHSVYKDYPLLSRYNSFGIKLGLRYKLFF